MTNPVDNVTGTSAADILNLIANKNPQIITEELKLVSTGNKIENAAMQVLLFNLKEKLGLSYRDLLAICLSLDAAAEKGVLNNDIINYLKENPAEINKIYSNEQPN
jgi:hypothetical protein